MRKGGGGRRKGLSKYVYSHLLSDFVSFAVPFGQIKEGEKEGGGGGGEGRKKKFIVGPLPQNCRPTDAKSEGQSKRKRKEKISSFPSYGSLACCDH